MNISVLSGLHLDIILFLKINWPY